MRNIKLEIEYDGRGYCGWQLQRSPQCPSARSAQKKSIQEVIEKALRKIFQEKVKLTASGRTDAGVHAQAQAANFRTNSKIPAAKLQRALNANLPDDIVIIKAEDVDLGFHSRFDAKSKVYRYSILNRAFASAFLRDRVYFYPHPLNLNLMRQEAKSLLGKHDFKAFCASKSGVKGTVRTIKKINIKKSAYSLQPSGRSPKERPIITIDIEADGFLYNMARNIAGTLIEIGRGRFPKGSAQEIMLSKNRKLAGFTAPARGLCLIKVNY